MPILSNVVKSDISNAINGIEENTLLALANSIFITRRILKPMSIPSIIFSICFIHPIITRD